MNLSQMTTRRSQAAAMTGLRTRRQLAPCAPVQYTTHVSQPCGERTSSRMSLIDLHFSEVLAIDALFIGIASPDITIQTCA